MRREDGVARRLPHREDMERLRARSFAMAGAAARNDARADSEMALPAEFDGLPPFLGHLGAWLGVSVDPAAFPFPQPALRYRSEREAVRVA